MPKIVTGEDKEIVRHMIREKAEQLIKEIGIKNITVTGICQSIPIGKGTFYYYYPSKEVLLFEIIIKKEQALMKQIVDYLEGDLSTEEKIIKAITEVYIGKESLVSIVTPQEIAEVMRVLPEEYIVNKDQKGTTFFEEIIKLLGIDSTICDIGVVGELLDGINYIASRKCKNGLKAKEEAIEIMIHSLAKYMTRQV